LSQFNVDLMAGRGPTPSEPMLPKPTLAQAVELALAAAQAADVETDRAAIMTAMKAVTRDAPVPDAVRDDLERRLAEEKLTDQTYEALASTMRARMDSAMKRADVRAMTAVREELVTRDRQLGGKRPGVVEALLREIDEKLQRAQAHRAALAEYMAIRPRLLEYEQDVRPVLSVLDGAGPSLTAMREMTGPGIYWLQKVDANLKRVVPRLERVVPPEELRDLHGTIASALQMAIDACRRRRLVIVTGDVPMAKESSSAAAGAMLLADHARRDLLARLHPPKIQ
jgi:hypothetical protein